MKLRALFSVCAGVCLFAFVLAQWPIISKAKLNPRMRGWAAPGGAAQPGLAVVPKAAKARVLAAYGRLPLSFEVNRGQADRRVKFLSRGSGYSLFLTPTEAVLTLKKPGASAGEQAKGSLAGLKRERIEQGAVRKPPEVSLQVLRIKLVGANGAPQVEGLEQLPGKSNYFIGNDPQKWRTNLPTYARVRYRAVYPGVDLVYYGNQRQLEHDFIVAPGADPRAIGLRFDGLGELSIDAQGDLVLASREGEIRLEKPVIYQEAQGVRQEIVGGYALKGKNQVGFEVATYDASRPLVIDPVLFYSTYLGGSGFDDGFAIAVDGAGNAYVTGCTGSANFPTTSGAFQNTVHNSGCFNLGGDAFVTKLNPTGSGLVYSTYLGGSSGDVGLGIAVDAGGNAYITGQTYSNDFPTTPAAFKTSFTKAGVCGGACPCAYPFVTKLNPSGSGLVYSTYVGGSGHESGNAIAVDNAGNAYITGGTQSTDFPTTAGAFQTTVTGVGTTCSPSASYATKVNSAGNALVYSTYLGNGGGAGFGIAVDSSGDAYVAGAMSTTNFPTTLGAFQTTSGGGQDATVTKLNPLGTGLVYSTYLGGSGNDVGSGIAIDNAGNAYVVGSTSSSNFPTTPGAFQTAFGGNFDAFVTKLNPLGTGLVYSTYLGGNGPDVGQGIAVDSSGNAYVTGFTLSTNFPTLNPFQAANAGSADAFVTRVNLTGTGLDYSTYLGGSGFDNGNGIAVDNLPNPNAYVAGATGSTNFPTTTGAFQTTFGGGSFDAFVAKISQVSTTTTAVGSSANPSVFGQSVTFTATVSPAGATGTVTFKDGATTLGTGTLNGSGMATFSTSSLSVGSHSITASYGGDSNFSTSTSGTLTQVVNQSPTTTMVVSATNPSVFGQSVVFTATVSASGGGAGTPTGTVTFKDGATTLGTGTLNGSGMATFSTSSLSVGSHSITAQYSGDSNFFGSTGSLTENVGYGICALYDQTRSVNSGAVFPIKVALCDVNSTDLSSSGVVLHATAVTKVSVFVGTPDSAGNANPDNDFRFDSTLGASGGYIFNLSTSGLASGTYGLQFTATGDPVTHSVNFGVK